MWQRESCELCFGISFFLHVGADDFPFNIPFKECFKLVVPPLGRRDPVLELQFV